MIPNENFAHEATVVGIVQGELHAVRPELVRLLVSDLLPQVVTDSEHRSTASCVAIVHAGTLSRNIHFATIE